MVAIQALEPLPPTKIQPARDERNQYAEEETHMDVEHDEPVANPDPFADEINHKLELILDGGSCVQSYEGTSQYSQQGISACGLASLNAARLIVGWEKSGNKGVDLLRVMMDIRAVEEIIRICSFWTSSAHLEVEEIYELPMFSRALRIVNRDYGQAEGDRFKQLLHHLGALVTGPTGVAVAVITKPPEIITVFCVGTGNSHRPRVFAIFDSHSRPDTHPLGAAFTFFGSTRDAGRYLSSLLSFDSALFKGADMQWQAQLLSQFSAHFIVAADTPPIDDTHNTQMYESNIAALETKSSVAAIQTNLNELTAENADLKAMKSVYDQQMEEYRRESATLADELAAMKRELVKAQTDLRTSENQRARDRERYTEQERKLNERVATSIAERADRDRYAEQERKGKERPLATFADHRASSQSERPSYAERLYSGAMNILEASRQPEPSYSRRSFGVDRDRDPYLYQPAQPLTVRSPFGPREPGYSKSPSSEKNVANDRAMALRLQQEMQEQERRDAALAAATQRALEAEDRRVADEHQRLLKSTFDCILCMEDQLDIDFVAEVDPCGHRTCRDCMRGHIAASIEQGRFPIRCPVCPNDKSKKRTGSFISRRLAEMVGLTEEESRKWWSFEMIGHGVSIQCRRCQQTCLVDSADLNAATIVTCPTPQCDFTWCKKCSQDVTGDGADHSCDGSKELDALMQRTGWKKCPKCHTPTEKTAGCNHMTCGVPGCNTHFDYVSGQLMRR